MRKSITVLGILLELSCLIDDFVGLLDSFRLIIGKLFHVAMFKKIFNFVVNIVNWGDRFIVHVGHFLFKIVQLDR